MELDDCSAGVRTDLVRNHRVMTAPIIPAYREQKQIAAPLESRQSKNKCPDPKLSHRLQRTR